MTRGLPLAAAFVIALLGATTAAQAATLAAAGAAPADAALGATLDSIARAVEQQGFHGLVVVARGGREILARGYGIANHATGARFSPMTVVPIGSNVKDFTKVAIFQLVEAGKLRLEDSLGEFFPDVPAEKRGITVDQLLDHRGGFPLGVAPDHEALSRAELLQRLWTRPLAVPPGSEERYSNAGFSLLAAIVEQRSGESFDAYVARAILAPIGLAETGLLKPRFEPSRLAHGYEAMKDQGTMLDRPHDRDGHLWSLRGNGGYLATAHDQLAFFRAIAAGKLLRERSHRDRVYDPRAATVLAGSDLISAFLFASFPRESIEVVIASNHAEHPAPRLLEAFEPAFGLTGLRRSNHHSADPVAPVAVPTEGGWRTVHAWLDAFRSGEEEAMRRFFESHAAPDPDAPPIERRLENYRRIRRTLGEFTVTATRETDDALEIDVRTGTGERASIAFLLERAAPYRVHGLRIQVG
jgi:CubicO group peptidase (beta-lactamase class C family)